jgi:RNA recognition motif. (a.k.a. RRM, RBD, or RNP domain)
LNQALGNLNSLLPAVSNTPGASTATPNNMGQDVNNLSPLSSILSSSSNIMLNTTLYSVLLEDMITLDDAKDPDLKDEILEEVSNYGDVEDVQISIKTTAANVIVKYKATDDANKACQALNGRYFAGRKVRATLV